MGLFSLFKKKHSQNESNNRIDNYVVFDLETTGLSRYYSEIIQISALRIKNGNVVDRFDTYIKPKKLIPPDASLINHITDDMVKDAPMFKEVINDFLAFVGDSLLVGYNISGFDLYLLNNRLNIETGNTFSGRYIDVLKMAQRIDEIENHRLVTIADYFGVATSGAHNALFDCLMTNECYKKLCERHIEPTISVFEGTPIVYYNKLSENNRAINILRSILSSIVEDGKVDETEFFEIETWVHENEYLKGAYPYDNICLKLDEVLEDGIVEESELNDFVGFIDEWLDPVGHARHKPINSLEGRHIVITGDFEYGPKDKVELYIKDKGAIIDNSTIKKTEMVIVGSLGSKAWVADNYGTKIKKALENREKGQLIEIISEQDFFMETKDL